MFIYRPKGLVVKKVKTFRDFGLLTEDRVFVIAEGGINHNGSVDLAKQLIDVAFETGQFSFQCLLVGPEKSGTTYLILARKSPLFFTRG